MQSLLYPNEVRTEKVFSQLMFKPYMSLFGEMFKPETATYAFDSVDSCQDSNSMLLIPSKGFSSFLTGQSADHLARTRQALSTFGMPTKSIMLTK